MTKQINIAILTTLDAKGARAAEQWIAQLTQATKQAGAIASKGGGASPFAAMSADAAKAEKDILRYASAMASAQRATGDTAGAVQTHAAALAQMTPNTIEAHRATTQLSGAQKALQKELSGGAGMAQQFGDAMKSSLMGIVGPAALAAGAIKLVGEAGELVKLGAQAEQTRVRFDQLAKQAHTTGDAMLASLRQASAGTISDTNLELAMMKANLLGVATSADQLGPLLAIARDRAQQMGISTAFAFDSLVTGLGRGSRLILDNIGVMVKEGEVNAAYARSVGKTVAQLTDQEKKQALVNEVVRQGNETMAATGGAVESNVAKLERLSATWENLKAAIGGGLADVAGPLADDIGKIAGSLQELSGTAGGAATPLDKVTTSAEGALTVTGQLQNTFAGLSAGLLVLTGHTDEANARLYQLAGATPPAASGLDVVAGSAINTASAVVQAAVAEQQAALVAAQLTAANQVLAPATIATADAHAAGEHEARAFSVATADATMASLADAAAKQEQTAQTELAAAQANAAADAFMALHPNITASGLASLATAGQINPLLAQLVLARIRAAEATAELARFRAMAGIAVQRNAPIADRAERQDFRHSVAVDQRNKEIAATNQAAEASRRLASVQGNEIPTIQHLRAEAEALKKTRGADSADYINKLADIAQAEQRAESAAKKGRGGRAGGGAAAAKAAQATGDRIEDITRVSGNKLADIQEQAQQKIAAIDAKYAAQRVAAQRALNEQIAEMSAAVKFDQTLDNFDAFQKDMTKEQQQAFAEREAAEVRYNERISAAQDEARNEAVNGDADFAGERLKIREAQAKRQMEIEQRAAQANADTNGKQKAAVAATAAAATKANEDQANTEIAIAQAKADEKAGAQQAEKDAVAAAAVEQANKVIAAAEESSTKVRKASADQRSTVIGNLQAQADAVKAWADAIASGAARAQSAMGGVTGPSTSTGGDTGGDTSGDNAAAGGGTFLTHGPTTLTVGDNPGGAELVHVVPLSGRGTTRVGAGMARMAGGGTLMATSSGSASSSGGSGDVLATFKQAVAYLDSLLPYIQRQNRFIKEVRTYQHTMQETIKIFADITTLHKSLAQPLPPISNKVFEDLAGEIAKMMTILVTKIDPNLAKSKRMFEHILAADKAAVAVFTEILNLRQQLAVPSSPIVLAQVQTLANEAMAIVTVLRERLIVANQHQSDELEHYAAIVAGSIAILKDVADLRKRLSENMGSPFDMALIKKFAERAAEITRLVETELIPFAEQQAAEMQRYADVSSAAVGLLVGVADLRKRLSEDIGGPFDMRQIKKFAQRAAEITRMVQAELVPQGEEQAAAMQRYADTAGSAIAILKDIADLRKRLSEAMGSPFDMNLIRTLADEARQITQIVQAVLVATTEETAAGFSRYADSVGSAVAILKGVADLRKDVADLAGPIPEKAIIAMADEAKRIAQIVSARLIPTTEEQAGALGHYADSVGSAVGIISDVAGLRKDATDLAGPIPVQAVVSLANEAKQIAQVVAAQLIPTTEDQADGFSRYASAVGSAVSVVRDAAGLRKDAADLAGPIPVAGIIRLADDAKRITQIVLARMVPASEAQRDAMQRFADTEGAAITALKNVLDMPAQAFADYRSPSDAQIGMVVTDANRIIRQVDKAARAYDTKGLDAAKLFSEAVGGTFAAFKDGLLFFEALNSGDFQLDPKNLAKFEAGMGQTMATAGRLGAQAVAIPAANITALQNVTAALTAAYESMIRLAAVPAGNLSQLAAGFGAAVGGGGGGSVVNNIYITTQPGQNANQIADAVIQRIGQRVGARH
jgi:hypothetical protein